MMKSCRYCGRIHPRGYECAKKPPPERYSRNRGNKERFRSSSAWQSTRRAIVFRDMGVCQICLEGGYYNSKELEVHHITPLEADFTMRLEKRNLITLCSYHHKQADSGEIEAEKLRAMAERNEAQIEV